MWEKHESENQKSGFLFGVDGTKNALQFFAHHGKHPPGANTDGDNSC